MDRNLPLAVALLLLASPLAAQNSQTKWPDCYCTDSSGDRVDLGGTICLHVDGRTFTARCEMAQNNPIWRETGDSCPVS